MCEQGDIRDQFLRPKRVLSGCIYGAILRNTTGRDLSHEQRFNHFPASPLCSLSLFFEGESHLNGAQPMARLSFSGPMQVPLTSWNPGPVRALSFGMYPEAWRALGGQAVGGLMDQTFALKAVAPSALITLCEKALASDDLQRGWQVLQAGLTPMWQVRRPFSIAPHYLADWSRALAVQAAGSGLGQSLRQAQRRMKMWTGQSARALETYGRIEALHHRACLGESDLAALAQAAGFADQSHMGRALRGVTGQSPARLRKLIAEEEAFWVYRLLGESL